MHKPMSRVKLIIYREKKIIEYTVYNPSIDHRNIYLNAIDNQLIIPIVALLCL